MLESAFEKQCIAWLKTLPRSYWPEKVDAPSVRGLPDRVGCIEGTYVAIEFKRTKAEANRKTGRVILQRKVLKDIEKAGGYSFIAHPENWNEVKAIILRRIVERA